MSNRCVCPPSQLVAEREAYLRGGLYPSNRPDDPLLSFTRAARRVLDGIRLRTDIVAGRRQLMVAAIMQVRQGPLGGGRQRYDFDPPTRTTRIRCGVRQTVWTHQIGKDSWRAVTQPRFRSLGGGTEVVELAIAFHPERLEASAR